MKNKDYEAAIKIAEKFSSYAPIQSQLMTVYVKNKDVIESTAVFSTIKDIGGW